MADCGYLSGAYDCENGDCLWIRFLKDACALLGGRSRGENIVDEDEISISDFLHRNTQLKGITKVLKPLFARKSRLAVSRKNSFERFN